MSATTSTPTPTLDPYDLTPAALTALAFVHLVGRMPKRIHRRTWSQAYQCSDEVKVNGRTFRVVSDPYVELVETHRMVRAARHLEGLGFEVRRLSWRQDGCRAVELARLSGDIDGLDVAHAYRTGYWSINYGRDGRGQVKP